MGGKGPLEQGKSRIRLGVGDQGTRARLRTDKRLTACWLVFYCSFFYTYFFFLWFTQPSLPRSLAQIHPFQKGLRVPKSPSSLSSDTL